jgi:hypothetical protein
VFDTTGVGYFEPGKKVPTAEELTELLRKERMTKVRVTRLQEVELPKADGAFTLTISGLG